jgi:hypothetical protein
MIWKTNSGYAVVAAGITLIIYAALAYFAPQWGSFLLLCSAGQILLLAISAMHWSVKKNNAPRFVVPAALGIVLICGVLLCAQTPEQPNTLSLDDLDTIHMGMRFEDIAREISGGGWISEADAFTVAYAVEGDMQLVLVFEDGIHLSGANLYYSDGRITTMGSTLIDSIAQ